MERKRPVSILRLSVTLISLSLAHIAGAQDAGQTTSANVKESISTYGRARVVVKLRAAEQPAADAQIAGNDELQRRRDIATRQQRIRERLRGTNHSVRREFRSLPYVVVEVDAAGLARLESASADVAQIVEDPVLAPILAESIPQMEADVAHAQGYDGSGSVIAIVDSGVDNSHPFLAGKVLGEACFADREKTNDPGSCPNGGNQQLGTGAAVPCAFAPQTCRHGTHVAGIAAGSGTTPGVAPSANLIAVQVFHRSTQCGFGEENPCARAFGSDITAALEYVYDRRTLNNITSVNMSLGGALATSACDTLLPATTTAINNLKTVGIATVIAAGNNASRASISFPACISTAISVGAVDDSDNVASFSNASADLDLFAPGVGVVSSVPGGGFASFSGTSMAAPHVAGSWAALRQANPLASVDDVLASLVNTGRPTSDGRGGGTVTKPRIRLGAALGIESPPPVVLSLAPSSMRSWAPGATLRILGSGFVRASVVYFNGAPRATTYVSDAELRAEVTTADLFTEATSIAITVITPPPGGGTSATVPLLVIQPNARLNVDRTVASVGTSVTVTMTDGTGVASDWLALARVADPNTSYLQWTYVGAVSTFVWTVNMPGPPGDYEFRLFREGTYTRIATSPTITVNSAAPPPPPPPPPPTSPPVLTLDRTSATVGSPVTVTLTNGTGVASDWIALARVGDPDVSYLNWTYVGAVSTFVWTANMPAPAGAYEFRVFSNGGYTRIATSPTITVISAAPPPPPPPPPPPSPPVLEVDRTSAAIGSPVTVTMTNGTGVASDWIALARVGDPDVAYLNWSYLGAVSTFVWTVNMPSPAGAYEFRVFSNGGFTRIATSPMVQVVSP